MTYIQPTWITLLINGTINNILFIILAIITATLITKLINKPLFHRFLDESSICYEDNKKGYKLVMTVGLFLILLLPASIGASYTWNMCMEQPSVRTDTITIAAIQPLPGAVSVTENGYTIENANQLMFITTDGREFANTENWMFNKFETRTIFNTLKINGTYKIRYYGWRNGHSNEFPNILSIEEIINENNTKNNEYNKYFGVNRGNRAYDLDFYEYGD